MHIGHDGRYVVCVLRKYHYFRCTFKYACIATVFLECFGVVHYVSFNETRKTLHERIHSLNCNNKKIRAVMKDDPDVESADELEQAKLRLFVALMENAQCLQEFCI